MTGRLEKTAAVIAASLVTAFAAYSVGSQSDGSASAAGGGNSAATRGAGDDGRGERLADLAGRLGVESADLRAALEEVRPDGRHGDMLAAIAKELGVSEAKVRAAFAAARPSESDRVRGGPGPGTAQLRRVARSLGVTAAKLRAAMRAAHEAQHEAPRKEHAAELAKALGVEQSAVEAALEKLAPDPGERRRGHRGDFVADLARELGKAEAEIDAALEKVHEAKEAEMEARREAFVKALAAKLGVSEDKVRDVLGDGPRLRGPGHHRRGAGGPGFRPDGGERSPA